MSRGKAFERELVQALRHWDEHGFVERFSDGMYKSGMSAKTPPDIIMVTSFYTRPVLIECKAVKGKSIPFNRLSEHQAKMLQRFPGESYVAVNFYNGKRGKQRMNKAWFVPYFDWYKLKKEGLRKSLSMRECEASLARFEIHWSKGQWNIYDALGTP